MKQTLRENLIEMLAKLIERQTMLDNNVKEYVKVGNWGDAAINQIKHDTIAMVVSKIQEILK